MGLILGRLPEKNGAEAEAYFAFEHIRSILPPRAIVPSRGIKMQIVDIKKSLRLRVCPLKFCEIIFFLLFHIIYRHCHRFLLHNH